MPNKRLKIGALVIALIPLAHAQEPASLDSRVAAVLTRMASSDRGTRNSAFDALIGVISEGRQVGLLIRLCRISRFLAAFLALHPDQAQRVKLGLINLLEADNVDAAVPAGYTAEDNSEHYAEAIDIVSCLKDERAIPALVGAMASGGGSCKGLLQYGQKPLGPVLDKLNDPDPLMRARAVGMGVTILRMKNDDASRAQILDLIRKAISDKEFLIRSAALYQIDNLTAQNEFVPALHEFVPALQEMAQRDPFTIPGQSNYPLRDRAKKLVNNITNH